MTAEARTGQGIGKAEARERARERAEKSGEGVWGICMLVLAAGNFECVPNAVCSCYCCCCC